MSDAEAVHLFVHGRVQGVFFRASTQKVAEGLELTGWVKNCSDGSVEVHAEGDKEKLEERLAKLAVGQELHSEQESPRVWTWLAGLLGVLGITLGGIMLRRS